MRANLQPIVANGQQLIRGPGHCNLQLMVVVTKDEAKKGFAERLAQAYSTLAKDFPEKGRPNWVRKRYNDAISTEAARKWLEGESIPDMGHIAMICTDLGVAFDWLFSGHGEMLVADQRPVEWPFQFSIARYEALTKGQKIQAAAALEAAIVDFEELLEKKEGT